MSLLLNFQYIILKLASIKILQKTVDYNYDQGTLASSTTKETLGKYTMMINTERTVH